MVSVHHSELVPDAGLSDSEMESLQFQVKETAVFETTVDLDDPSSLTIAGIDQSFIGDTALSAIVVRKENDIIERVYETTSLSIPYIPGYLAFREGPPIIQALSQLDSDPDVLLVDGNGRLHYREAGLATHIGVVVDLPTIGVAKSLLCGQYEQSIDNLSQGSQVPIYAREKVETTQREVIGYAVQTRQYESGTQTINPVFVSAGHRINGRDSVDLVLEQCAGYKLPEPIRLADQYAASAKQTHTESNDA